MKAQFQETNWTSTTPAGSDQGDNFAWSTDDSNFPASKALLLTQTQETLGPKEVSPVSQRDWTSSEEPGPCEPLTSFPNIFQLETHSKKYLIIVFVNQGGLFEIH